MAFGTEDPNVEGLEEVRSVRREAGERDTFAGGEVDKLPGQM